MRDRVGIVGIGAMGGALLKGLLNSAVAPEKLVIADSDPVKMQQAADTYSVEAKDIMEMADVAGIIILAVKPQDIQFLLQKMAPALEDGQTIVSVAAGVTIAEIEQNLAGDIGVIRVMPNTPCLIGEGAMAVSAGKFVEEKNLNTVVSWLSSLGYIRVVPEKLMDAVTGVSGSGPAYVYMMIEALADGGVLAGLPRDLAHELAVQTVLGSAKMVKETGRHPAALREMVTSPGGTTAAALFEPEQGVFKGTVQKAVKAAALRSKELGQ